MFELIFGLVWCLIVGFITYGFYGTDAPVTVNGELMEHSEFSALLMPKLFLGLFWIVGIVMLIIGLRRIIRNTLIATRGEETYGIVMDVRPSNIRIKNRPVWEAEVALLRDGHLVTLTATVCTVYNQYKPGDFMHLKCYKNDINILGKALRADVPYNILTVLETQNVHPHPVDFIDNSEYIIVNGQRYRKVD
jgi:hypothetical protein